MQFVFLRATGNELLLLSHFTSIISAVFMKLNSCVDINKHLGYVRHEVLIKITPHLKRSTHFALFLYFPVIKILHLLLKLKGIFLQRNGVLVN